MRTYVVTGAASGIGQATTRLLRERGDRVITVDLHDADVIADLSTTQGRVSYVSGITQASGGAIDGVLAIAGTSEPTPEAVSVNFFGAVASLEGALSLMGTSRDPRAVTVTSTDTIHPIDPAIVDACLRMDEARAREAAETAINARAGNTIYPSTKHALARWVRRAAPSGAWAGRGILLNAMAPATITSPLRVPGESGRAGQHILDEDLPQPWGPHSRDDVAARLLAWLCSPEARPMTGEVIQIATPVDVAAGADSAW